MDKFVRETEWIEKKPRPKLPRRYNDPERVEMLATRYAEQRARRGGVRMVGVPASINRRTGKPHEHNRERARRRG